MKFHIFSITSLIVFLCFKIDCQAQNKNFNDSWLFYNDKIENAQQADFDDTSWRKLYLPHDWAIEGPFDKKYNARCGGLPFHGTGWYRKHFHLSEENKGKVVRLEFEGAMYDAHVWINGKLVGNRPFGYIGFEFDISTYLNYGDKENVVAVRLEPKDLSSRWYPGAGLYRSVWLKIDEPIFVSKWGTYITSPTVTKNLAVVQNETTINNKSAKNSTITVTHKYLDPFGKKVASTTETLEIPSNSSVVSATYTQIENPVLWDIYQPNLYKVVTTLSSEDKLLDTYNSTIGLRSISYDTKGFYLNGRKVRFNGACLHHDNGALGAAVYKRADQRKLQIMKEMGVNAIRTSHNPPSREFLEVCDELGLLVLDEAFDMWRKPKVENGYSVFYDEWSERDLKDMIRRDRNHPSIIMWSVGNEILEQSDKKNGWKEIKRLNDFCKETDPTRPTTVGMNNYQNPYNFNFAQQVDIAGMNYKPSKYGEIHEKYPQLALYGSETSSCTSSRGVYHQPITKYEKHPSKHVTSYDLIGPVWAYPPDIEFHFQEENPNVMGEFIWTGFDYLGEPTPYGGRDNSTNGYWNGDWPTHASYFGAVDMCGFPKDRFYLYQSQWTEKPMVHLLPHWNWPGLEEQEIPVYCYTNCDEAELFVNGKSFGKKTKGKDLSEILVDFLRYEPKTFKSKYRLSWMVPYTPGNIKVVGYKDGKKITEETIHTAGKPAKIDLSVDRKVIDADGNDLAYVTIKILDKNGNICPNADNLVNFSIRGKGDIIAVDNGNQISLESFIEPKRKAFNGMCLAVIKSTNKTGKITLYAKSQKLKSAKIVIETK
ncbi:glycoside hydrolase family 2 TIM barrel-domain containing protein [Flavicella marina]|uniref:glycoside hydrolase family 2 TIM barrel-domain containing protein n=1 Tax=Flavicella marina TaxID=1475951 RepID=UPI001263F487|nr:glycoside hydrolase family 2 TIM barrel-domain containing protein [Flavicella marina]